MNVLQNTQRKAVRGLTLIELVVVLAILVALVGLVLAFFPGLLSRASRSTSASSIQDVARAVQINYTTALSYGTGYDSLLNTGGGALFTKLPTASSAQMTRITTLSAADVTALNSLGISTIHNLDNTITGDATFNVTEATPVTLAASTPVATISDATVRATLLGNRTTAPANPIYLVVGLNKRASVVGNSQILQDAPVRAGSNANENPTTAYQRYGLVFLIEDSGSARAASFLGAVAFTSTGITTAEGNLQQYYNN